MAARTWQIIRPLAFFVGEGDGEFDGEQAEEGGEFDDGVEGDGAGVLEGVADGVADDGGVVERGAFGLEFGLDDFLGVVPGAAGVGHEDGLVEAEEGDGDEVADEEEGSDEGEGEGGEEDGEEDVDHAFLGVLGADADDFFGVGDGGFFGAFEVDVAA